MILSWLKDFDADDEEMWAAASPYHDEGSPLYFRITKVGDMLRLASDAELVCPEHKDIRFATLEDAKVFCQKQCDEIIAEIQKEQTDGGEES